MMDPKTESPLKLISPPEPIERPVGKTPRFLNRELSWLGFNARVLDEALNRRTPLLERVKYMQIFTSNLDEFFMKRVGFLKHQLALKVEGADSSGMTTVEVLAAVRRTVLSLLHAQAECWNQELQPALEREGIVLLRWSDLAPTDQIEIEQYFHAKLFPILTPLAVDPGHPFPLMSNLSTSLGLLLRDQQRNGGDLAKVLPEALFARVKFPTNVPTLLRLKSRSGDAREARFIQVRDVIEHFVRELFPGMDILGTMFFSVTRNQELQKEEEAADDLLHLVSESLRERRFARVIRLEHGPAPIEALCSLLKHELQLSDDDIYPMHPSVDFSGLEPIWELNRKDLRFRPWTPSVPAPLTNDNASIFSVVREKDLLVHHPYESFRRTVQRFLESAVADPAVHVIKTVLYRMGDDNPFIPLLVRAAEAGKQVIVIVEIQARFDEARNIQAVKALERAGVHVVYGVVGLKTHCKAILVTREEGDEMRSYVHISTGNYNPLTAKVYTDFGFFTAQEAYTREINHLFNFLTGRSRFENYQKLLIAPLNMKDSLIGRIKSEGAAAANGRPARIIAKMNSLEDRDVIEALYQASSQGVRIDLLVRGVCCLRPQVPGLSENIRVTSVVGRFLEHSRIYYFQSGSMNPLDGTFLIGSADWMRRNLSFRVEALVHIEDRTIRAQLWAFLNMMLKDRRQGWSLLADGSSKRRRPVSATDQESAHDRLMTIYESAGLSAMGFPTQAPIDDLPDASTALFDKDPRKDKESSRKKYSHPSRGVQFYFNHMLPSVRERLAELFPPDVPCVFLHSKAFFETATGELDRSGFGPYALDIVRLLVSASLRQTSPTDGLIDPQTSERLRKGYLRGLRRGDRSVAETEPLKDSRGGQKPTDAYLKANGKCAAQMRSDPLPASDPRIVGLVDGYLRSRNEPELLESFFIEEAGRSGGGKGETFFAVLAPKQASSTEDRILFRIERVEKDAERWKSDPLPSESVTELPPPSAAPRPRGVVVGGVEYFVCQISPRDGKVKSVGDRQKDFIGAVGTQLGRAHRSSVQGAPDLLEKHCEQHWATITSAAQLIRDEIAMAHARYVRRAKEA
jgi:polyphosphate kinase